MRASSLFLAGVIGLIFLSSCHALDRPIYYRLKSDLSSLNTHRSTDPSVSFALAALNQIAPIQPLIQINSRSNVDIEALRAHRLTNYQVITPDQFNGRNPDEIVRELSQNPLVETALHEPEIVPAGFLRSNEKSAVIDYTDCQNFFGRCQKYMLEPEGRNGYKLGGVNAFKAQKLANNMGEDVTVMMMEIDMFDADHIDLKQPYLVLGQGKGKSIDHCTMSAGLIFGQDNGFGVTGIVPKAKIGFTPYSAQKMVELGSVLQAGDVLQVGIQYEVKGPHCIKNVKCYLPVEWNPAVYDAISYLTQEKGVHVIQAAANGDIDLDHWSFNNKFSRSRDSLSIYAGAAAPTTGNRAAFSDYGSRVDTFSWGMLVTSTTYKPGQHNLFTTGYSGTSSANPIITGCAAFVQSVARARGMGNLHPKVLRQLLVDSGRPLPYPDSKNIGTQPDLVKALELLDQLSGKPTSTSTKSTTATTKSTSSTKPLSTSTTRPTVSTSTSRPSTSSSTSSPPLSGDCKGIAAWRSDRIYDNKGEEVAHNGNLYRQSYWNRNQTPDKYNGQGQPWELIRSCNNDDGQGGEKVCNGVPQWNSTKGYIVYGEKVSHNGKVYMVNFGSTSLRPDQNSAPWGKPWILVGDC